MWLALVRQSAVASFWSRLELIPDFSHPDLTNLKCTAPVPGAMALK
jgi:hypothetical protein